MLTGANLLLLFVLQKLASVLSDREQMRVSQGALLKQVCVDIRTPYQLFYLTLNRK